MRPKTPDRPWKSYRATVSSKGQITIPRAIQRHLGWQAGDWLLGEVFGNDRFALRRIDPNLGQAIRERQRARHKLTDDEALREQLARARTCRKEADAAP